MPLSVEYSPANTEPVYPFNLNVPALLLAHTVLDTIIVPGTEGASIVIFTVSIELLQLPFDIVHMN